MFFQGVGGKGVQSFLFPGDQRQMLDHQPPEEHAEKPAVKRGEQEGGLGGTQPEIKLEIRQFQTDHVIDDVLVFRQVRIDDAPDFHEVPP